MEFLKRFLSLPAIIGNLPNQIINGQLIDAVPVMANLNFIASQVNANVPPLIPVVTNSLIFVPAGSVGGTPNAITLAPTPALGAYAAGVSYRFPATAPNTGSVVINVSGLGNQALTYASGLALNGSELQTGGIYDICYNGAAFELVNSSQGTNQTTTYTPVLSFNGVSTGIVYAAQNGQYFKIGPLVFVSVQIVLTNKGVAAGNAYVTLPFPPNSLYIGGASLPSGPCNLSQVAFGANSYVTANVVPGTVFGNPNCNFGITGNSASQVFLNNTSFANTSQILFSAVYPV